MTLDNLREIVKVLCNGECDQYRCSLMKCPFALPMGIAGRYNTLCKLMRYNDFPLDGETILSWKATERLLDIKKDRGCFAKHLMNNGRIDVIDKILDGLEKPEIQ